MKLRRLCKSVESIPQGQCPALYIAEEASLMVGQGKRLDTSTTAELIDLADDEQGVAIPTETVLRAAALLLAEYGRPAMLAEVEDFLRNSWPTG